VITKEQYSAATKMLRQALTQVPDFENWDYLQRAYRAGKKARRMGWPECPYPDTDRVRPYYWEAGYQGLPFIDPREVQP
jgi:hypothetical protein